MHHLDLLLELCTYLSHSRASRQESMCYGSLQTCCKFACHSASSDRKTPRCRKLGRLLASSLARIELQTLVWKIALRMFDIPDVAAGTAGCDTKPPTPRCAHGTGIDLRVNKAYNPQEDCKCSMASQECLVLKWDQGSGKGDNTSAGGHIGMYTWGIRA